MERTMKKQGRAGLNLINCRSTEKHMTHWRMGSEEEMVVSISTSHTRIIGRKTPALSSAHRVRTTVAVDCGHHGKLSAYTQTSALVVTHLSYPIISISVKSKWTRNANTWHWLTPFSSPCDAGRHDQSISAMCLMRRSQALTEHSKPMRKTGTCTENHFSKLMAIMHLHLSSSWEANKSVSFEPVFFFFFFSLFLN